MISKKEGNAPRAADLEDNMGKQKINPPQASVLDMGTQYLLYRTDKRRFAAHICHCWQAYLGLIHVSCVTSHFSYSSV